LDNKTIRLWAQIVISIILLVAALWIVLVPVQSEPAQRIAYSILGSIITFWMRQ
jgi:hypothetical protein